MITADELKDRRAQRTIDALVKAMDAAVGEELYEQMLFDLVAWGTVLPETQAEIQRRMASALMPEPEEKESR